MEPTKSQGDETERRQYQKPELQEYGRLADLTRATNSLGLMGDGGMSGLVKSD
jgi:hypothetical protein